MARLRKMFPENKIVLITEANMSCGYPALAAFCLVPLLTSRGFTGVTASHMSHVCAPYRLSIMTDHKTGNKGIITTNETKV